MECLRDFLDKRTKKQQTEFAIRCGTTIGYLRKAINKRQELGPIISVAIEQVSGGEVTRQMLHPLDFHKKWPELAVQEKNLTDKAA